MRCQSAVHLGHWSRSTTAFLPDRLAVSEPPPVLPPPPPLKGALPGGVVAPTEGRIMLHAAMLVRRTEPTPGTMPPPLAPRCAAARASMTAWPSSWVRACELAAILAQVGDDAARADAAHAAPAGVGLDCAGQPTRRRDRDAVAARLRDADARLACTSVLIAAVNATAKRCCGRASHQRCSRTLSGDGCSPVQASPRGTWCHWRPAAASADAAVLSWRAPH